MEPENTTKRCSGCKIEQDIASFGSNKARKDGLDIYCRPCRRAKTDAWQAANREKTLQSQRDWKTKNRTKYEDSPQSAIFDKFCTMCEQTKKSTEFHKNKSQKDGLQGYCKTCSIARQQQYVVANREKTLERYNKYRKSNPERHKEATRNSRLKRTYGIDTDEYSRMLDDQNGVCAICKQPEKVNNPRYGTPRLSVDHSHETNNVRQLLCHACNTALGQFERYRSEFNEYICKHGDMC